MKIDPDSNGTLAIEYELGDESEIRHIDGKIETFWREKIT